MFSPQLGVLCFLPFLTYTYALQLVKFSFWHGNGGDTLCPIPQDIIFITMKAETNDPSSVELRLYNIDRMNETLVLSGLDPVRDENVGFEVPWVPPGNFWIRVYSDFSTKNFLVQSSTFQIYAPNATGVSIHPPSASATIATTSTRRSQPSSSSDMSTTSSNKTGIIIGATLGGVAFLLLVIILIFLWHRKSSKPKEHSTFSLSHSKPLPTLPPTTNPEAPFEAARNAASRAENLRKERERLDREIITLEGTVRSLTRHPSRPALSDRREGSGNGDGMARSVGENGESDVHSQLEALRAQVKRLESTIDAPPEYH